MTVPQYRRLKRSACGICDSRKHLRIDHDHDTGQVRGVLCNTCNIGLGMLGDDAEGVRRALDYLEK